MILETLLSGLPVRDFLEKHWTLLPHVAAGAAAAFRDLADDTTLDAALEAPDADVLVVRDGRPVPCEGRLDGSRARGLREEGCTIVQRHAERGHPGLARLADGLRHDLAGPVDVQVYRSERAGSGFGWHYDAEEVFILQLRGAKSFRLARNTVQPWPLVETLPNDMRFELERSPFGLDCRLEAGDLLYVPSGWWHRATAEAESVTVAAGVLAPPALELVDLLRERLAASPLWRRRLPAAGEVTDRTEEELRSTYAELLRGLAVDLERELGRPELPAELIARIRRAGATPSGGPGDGDTGDEGRAPDASSGPDDGSSG